MQKHIQIKTSATNQMHPKLNLTPKAEHSKRLLLLQRSTQVL